MNKLRVANYCTNSCLERGVKISPSSLFYLKYKKTEKDPDKISCNSSPLKRIKPICNYE